MSPSRRPARSTPFPVPRGATGRFWPPAGNLRRYVSPCKIEFDVEFNRVRRAGLETAAVTRAKVAKQIETVQCPEKHDLAVRVEKAFESAKSGEDGRISIHRHTTPHITASFQAAERIVIFLSTLAYAIEAQGIKMVTGKTESEPLRFSREEDVVHLYVEEEIEYYEVEPTPEQKRQPSWTWNNKRSRPSGQLTFRLTSPNRTSGRCKWSESESSKAVDFVPKIVPRIHELFENWKNAREQERLREQRRAEESKAQAAREVKERHEGKIKAVKKTRRNSLFRASMWLQTYRTMVEYIDACESKWQKEGPEISEDRKMWLEWARAEAEGFNPLNFNYPVPDIDGPFDEGVIPVGGPYPEAREMPLPKLLKEIKHLVSDQRPYRGYGW